MTTRRTGIRAEGRAVREATGAVRWIPDEHQCPEHGRSEHYTSSGWCCLCVRDLSRRRSAAGLQAANWARPDVGPVRNAAKRAARAQARFLREAGAD